jgi:GNAT superfamily N-acetyltransferase/ribosomal protein S18 acetylase RimI-like enzyme
MRLYIMGSHSDELTVDHVVATRRWRTREMHIHAVDLKDLDIFIDAAGSPDHRSEVERYLDRMFTAGSMRPEWCFIAEDGDGPVGRVAFWTLPGIEEPFALVLLDVDWERDHAAVGTRLLRYTLDAARDLGARDIEHVIDTPPTRPQFQHHEQERIELLQSAGFYLRRVTGRYERRGTELPAGPRRLMFRTLEEVGKRTFIEAMERVSEDTLDHQIRAERERLGTKRAAQEFFDDASRVRHVTSWWRLAYTPTGELAGLIMPAEPPGFLTIFYVGVVPDMRGRGYVNDLLAAGTSTLLQARKVDEPLIADTDVSNAPMAAAFERAGWTRFAGRQEYVVDLAPDRG